MQDFGLSMLCFWAAYIAVTLVGIGHTVLNIYVLKMSPMDETGMGEGYEKTKPWHPLYNILLFSTAGLIYMGSVPSPSFGEAALTGLIWAAVCAVFDVFGWVIIKHPWSLTFRQFYIEYQPWISLIYIAIFSGPVAGWLITLL